MIAAQNENLETVRTLIAAGAKKELKSKAGYTAMDLARKYANNNIVQLLHSEGCKGSHDQWFRVPHILDKLFDGSFLSILFVIITLPIILLCMPILLLFFLFDLIKHDNYDTTQLILLINTNTKDDINSVKALIDSGADVNQVNCRDETAVIWAARDGKAKILKLLIENGADLNKKDCDGNTAIMLAVIHGQTEIVEILLEHQADINAVNSQGDTALILASSSKKPTIVNLLLHGGANIEAINSNGLTALQAAEDGKQNCINISPGSLQFLEPVVTEINSYEHTISLISLFAQSKNILQAGTPVIDESVKTVSQSNT